MSTAQVVVSIDVNDIDVTFHCVHDRERVSYRITPKMDGVTVYLTGTTPQLMTFANAILDVARAEIRAELSVLLDRVNAELAAQESEVEE